MNIHVIFFTKQGADIAHRLVECLEREHMFTLFQGSGEHKTPLSEFVQYGFQHAQGLIFISATGIAVRSIAPFLKHKLNDPAILVLDDKGQFVISLLSGHWGQANQLTSEIAAQMGSIPVLTTSTDNHHVFAVDNFAKQEGYTIVNPEKIKVVSGRLLRGECVTTYCELPITPLPTGLVVSDSQTDCQLALLQNADTIKNLKSLKKEQDAPLFLVAQEYYVGIGCRKDTSPDLLEDFVLNQLDLLDISLLQVVGIASVDVKKEEKALLLFCEKYNLQFTTFSPSTLQAINGNFTASSFVLSQIGTDNVCERSAIALGGAFIVREKISENGITLAVAKKEKNPPFHHTMEERRPL